MDDTVSIDTPTYQPLGHKYATPVQQKMLGRLMKLVNSRRKSMHKIKPKKKKVKIV